MYSKSLVNINAPAFAVGFLYCRSLRRPLAIAGHENETRMANLHLFVDLQYKLWARGSVWKFMGLAGLRRGPGRRIDLDVEDQNLPRLNAISHLTNEYTHHHADSSTV